MDKNFSKLCTPARIYFAIAVIATIIALFNGVTIMFAVMKMLFASIWTFLLSWLCSKGYTSVSWFLVLLPYVLIGLAMFGVVSSQNKSTKEGMAAHYTNSSQSSYNSGQSSNNSEQNNRRRHRRR